MDTPQLVGSLGIGLGLSAACGFRVFLPILALGVAARTGTIPLAPDFAWIASTPALIAFGAATLVEALGYFIPWLDHALDVIATPAAVLAGLVATAAVFTEVPPLLRWGAALIGGGGMAGLVQGATVLARLKSAALTGGIGNPLVAVLELGGAAVTSILAILLPASILVMVALLITAFIWFGRRRA